MFAVGNLNFIKIGRKRYFFIRSKFEEDRENINYITFRDRPLFFRFSAFFPTLFSNVWVTINTNEDVFNDNKNYSLI